MPPKKSKPTTAVVEIVPAEVENRIHVVRGVRVMIDAELAELYGVPTKALNQAVERNEERFPSDFAFHLTEQEVANLNRSYAVADSGKL